MIDEKILIERLEEEMKGHLNLYCDGLIKAMSIAKDLAESYHIHCEQEYMKGYEDGAESVRAMMPYEEHNNGWIPCSERMPEYEKEMYLVQTAYGLMDVLRFTKDAYKLDKYDFYEYKNKKRF